MGPDLQRGLRHTIINNEKSCFDILITVYLENALMPCLRNLINL